MAYGEEAGCAFFPGVDVPYLTGDFWSLSFGVAAEEIGAELPTEPYEALIAPTGGSLEFIDC